MAINSNVLAENQATVLADDGNVMYATIQMRHGKESEMDKSKFVPAEIGVATDTKKAFMAFSPGNVKEMMFREDSEIEELLGEVRKISDQAVEAVESAEATAKQAIEDYTDQMKATIPEDYTEMVKKVDVLERTKAPAIMQTATGKFLQIEDSADAPVAGLKVFGRSEQVQTTGAQLLDESIFNNLPHDANVIYKPIRVQNNGEYTLSTDMDTGKASTNLFLLSGNVSTGANSSTNGAYKDHPITVQSSDNYVTVGYRYGTVSPLNPKDYHNMLNSGSAALPWEPYTGGVPGPNPDYPQDIEIPGSDGEIEVSMTGNLVNIDDFVATSNATISRSGNELKVTSSTRYMGAQLKLNDYIDILKGQKITAWSHVKATNTTLYIVQLMYTIDGSNKYTTIKENSNQGMWRKVEVDIPNGNITNIQISINPISNDNADTEAYVVVDDIGIIIGSWNESQISGLPFSEPVQVNLSTPNGLPGIPVDSGGNYTDSDGQQWICDEVDFTRGKYVQRVKKVDLGDITFNNNAWTNMQENFVFAYSSNLFSYSDMVLSDKLQSIKYTGNVTSINNESIMVERNSSDPSKGILYIVIKKERIGEGSTVGVALNSYLKTAGISVLCKIDEVETDLSEEELAAYAALRTNYPTTVVTSDADPAVDMEVEYVADTKTYIDNKFAELAQNLAATQNTLLEV